jgi:hypothetical protein
VCSDDLSCPLMIQTAPAKPTSRYQPVP